MRTIDLIVVHCSATRVDTPLPPKTLDRLHRKRGFRCTGYHYYLRRSGEVVNTRPVEYSGAHAKGYNAHSIGVCYEGGLDLYGHPADTRTPEQRKSLYQLLADLQETYPHARVCGHRDLPHVHKACPCFDVKTEL